MDIHPHEQGLSVAHLVVDGADAMLVDTAIPRGGAATRAPFLGSWSRDTQERR